MRTTFLGDDAAQVGHLVLLRHGQTAWSLSGQHTGLTDISLTEVGQRQAMEAGERLHRSFPHGFQQEYVFSSPLERAKRTAALAGFTNPKELDVLREWDYGRAEGRTRLQITHRIGRSWSPWDDGPQNLPADMEGQWFDILPSGERVYVHNSRGESLEEVAQRARAGVHLFEPLVASGHDVLVVAHSHILRILATQWLRLSPKVAKVLRLDTAHFSVLGHYKGDNVIEHWNN